MPQFAEKKLDDGTERVQAVAEGWLQAHGFDQARVEVSRRMPGRSIRVRVIDKRFSGQLIEDRDRMTQGLLDGLPEEIDQEITLVLLLGPDEMKKNLMSAEFDN